MNSDDRPPSQRTFGPASSRSPSSRPPPSSQPGSQRRVPSQRRPEPQVEILSPLPPGDPAAPEGHDPPPAPPPQAEGASRPVGLLLGVGAMLLVPAVVAGLVLAYVPRLRPWSADGPATTASAAQVEAPVPEGKVQVSGRVVDDDGDPVEGAHVGVFTRGRETPVAEMLSGKGGVYSFDVEPGRHVLVAEHDDKGMAASAELMLARGASVKNMVLTLGPVRTVRGTISGEDGARVVGASIKLDSASWLHRTATSEADGAYRLPRVPPVEASLRVVAAGYAPALIKLKSGAPAGEEVIDIKLSKEQNIEGQVYDPDNRAVRAGILACDGKEPGQRVVSNIDGRFKIAREFARCPLVAFHDSFAPSEPVLAEGSGQVTLKLRAGGGIAGVVVDDDGAPVKAFFVGVESFVPAFADRLTLRPGEAKPVEDASGAFAIDRLAPGSYVLSAWADGRSMVRSPSIEVRAGQTTQGVRVVIPRGGSVEGQIVDDERKAPLAGARVSFDTSSSVRREGSSVVSDDAGKFHIEGAPQGPFSLRVERDGYRTRILSGLRVASGEALKQEITLKPAGDGGTGLDFVGIGAALENGREGIVFRRVYEGAPAEQAGLKAGDLLRRIDGHTIEGLSLADAIQRLRGEKGSQVRLAVERPPGGEFLELTITRNEIVR